MSKAPIAIADALGDQLGIEEFSMTPASIQRAYVPTVELSETSQLQLVIFPNLLAIEDGDETAWDRETSIHIGVLYKFPIGTERDIPVEQIDPLTDFVHELIDYFTNDDYEAPLGMDIERVESSPLFHPDHLLENRQFTSVISVTFREVV